MHPSSVKMLLCGFIIRELDLGLPALPARMLVQGPTGAVLALIPKHILENTNYPN